MRGLASVAMSGVAVVVAIASLVVSWLSQRTARLDHFKGPELLISFEHGDSGFGDLLVLENVGDAALDMDVSVYIDPKEDDRFPLGESQPVWIFRRRLFRGWPQKWHHGFGAILTEMGYRQDCVYIVRFIGSFWSSAAGKRFPRPHKQVYQVSSANGSRLYVEQSDADWYYADAQPKRDLRRREIPESLRKDHAD